MSVCTTWRRTLFHVDTLFAVHLSLWVPASYTRAKLKIPVPTPQKRNNLVYSHNIARHTRTRTRTRTHTHTHTNTHTHTHTHASHVRLLRPPHLRAEETAQARVALRCAVHGVHKGLARLLRCGADLKLLARHSGRYNRAVKPAAGGRDGQ